MRVAVYNVQGFRAGTGLAVDAIGPEDPDLVMIQECGSRRSLRRFAAALGMERVSTHRLFGRVRNAVLYRLPWRLAGVETRTFPSQGGTSPRGMIAAHLRRAGTPFTAMSAHLGLSPGERTVHVRELADLIAGVSGAVVLGVDLNEGPDGEAARWISERLFDVFSAAGEASGVGGTFPAGEPTARIDYLFVNDRVRPLRAWVPSNRAAITASDHRPLLAELEMP
jgi:endonuclease/exonuclease/phosphatase family metal-dependent hydrolase